MNEEIIVTKQIENLAKKILEHMCNYLYYAACICYDHNQSLVFCEKCRQQAIKNKLEAEKMGKEKFITQKLQTHNKNYWGVEA
jgi:hypothetical protein